MTFRSLVASAIAGPFVLLTGACSGGWPVPDYILPPPLVDADVGAFDGLGPVAQDFFETFESINGSRPTPRPVSGTGVFDGRAIVRSDGGALSALGDAQMIVDFDSGRFSARFENFENHDVAGNPAGALSGALEVQDGTTAGPGFQGDLAGTLTSDQDAFDVSGAVEGMFGESGAPVLAGQITGTVSGSESGSVGGLFFGSR